MRESKVNSLYNFFTFSLIKIFTSLIATVCVQSIYAQDLNVIATVDRNLMENGDTFTLSVSITGKSSSNFDEPRLPNLKFMDLINSWSGSEVRSSFVNGQFVVSQTKTFNYMLAPNREGKIIIDPIEISANGKVYKTKPIEIDVKKSGTLADNGNKNQRPQKDNSDPFGADPFSDMEDMFNQLLRRRNSGTRTQPINPKESFFIQVEVDKDKVFAGEQITASWYLYTRGLIRDIDTIKYPSLNGFWKEDIDLATRLDFQQEVINGIVYRKALLASYALFPIKAGKATIDSYKAKCTVISDSTFGFGRPSVYTKASKPISIEVMPVPVNNRPADYTGAVGSFNVSALLSDNTVAVNQPVTLKIKFEGKGNAKLIELPSLNLPPSIEIYDTKSESKFFKNGQSYKEFEVLLIPRESGVIQIPELTVSLFDPEKEEYYKRVTNSMTLSVTPGEAGQVITSTPLEVGNQNKEKKADQEIKNIAPQVSFSWTNSKNAHFLVKNVWGLGALVISIFTLLIVYLYEFGFLFKSKKLHKTFKERIIRVKKLTKEEKWREVGVESTNLINYVLGNIIGHGGGIYSIDKLIAQLPPTIKQKVEKDLNFISNQMEALGFAPEEIVKGIGNFDNVNKLVSKLENALEIVIQRTSGNENAGFEKSIQV